MTSKYSYSENWREWRTYFNQATCHSIICQRKISDTKNKQSNFHTKNKALLDSELNTIENFYKNKILELQSKSLYKDHQKNKPYNKSFVVVPLLSEFLFSHKEAPRQISDHKLVKTIFKLGDREITHGSLNALLMADAFTGGLGRTIKSSERVYDLFHYLMANNLDIISLQEVFYRQSDSKHVPQPLKALEGLFHGTRARLVLVRLLTLAGYNVLHNAGKNNIINGKLENSGLLIASKFKIKNSNYFSYAFDGRIKSKMADKLSDKGILKAELETDQQQKIIIYNTHAQASLWEWDLYNKKIDKAIFLEEENINIRIKQYDFLASLMKKEEDYDLLISSGDFNLSDKFLTKRRNTLVYKEDPEEKEIKSYKRIFKNYIADNLLEEDTWIPEYEIKDSLILTRNFRLNGVFKVKDQGSPSLTIIDKRGESYLFIPSRVGPHIPGTRKRSYQYNIEWSLTNRVALDQVLFNYRNPCFLPTNNSKKRSENSPKNLMKKMN